jgi:hypothetical protein
MSEGNFIKMSEWKRRLGRLAVVAAICASLAGANYAMRSEAVATCIGAKNCTACKNCKYCGHCSKDGGTCEVCKKGMALH